MHTLSELRLLLAQMEHLPKKSLGQNFLIDRNILSKSLSWANLYAGDVVVEVGPGLGTLTSALLESGAHVYAVEKDEKLAQYLLKTLGQQFDQTFFLTVADAMEFPLAGLPKSCQRYSVVANLPYAIATPWLESVLSMSTLPEKMVLMLQKEAVERLFASSGSKAYSAMSIFLSGLFECTQKYVVSCECFHPRPAVTSELVLLIQKKNDQVRFEKEVKHWMRFLFSQRRKQLGSSLRNSNQPALSQLFTEALLQAGFTLTHRAEDIPMAVWAKLGVREGG